MPYGMQVWDVNGSPVFDLTDRLTRLVSVVQIPVGASGQLQLPEGTAWWYVTPNGSASSVGSAYAPLITVNSNNLLNYAPNTMYGAGQVDCTLVAGVY